MAVFPDQGLLAQDVEVTSSPPPPGEPPHTEHAPVWSNWAGNQSCRVPVVRPTTESELQRIVADAASGGRHLKAVGTGHSFTGVALTDGLMVALEDYGRIRSVDRQACTVTVEAGCRLSDLSAALWTRGLALPNLGDIDVQTVSGATATATHGTGLGFGNISSAVVGLRLVDGTGAVVDCDAERHPEVFRAARAGLGALGLVSTLTLQCVPAYHLHAVHEPRPVDEVLESFDELVAAHDHFEFFWVPGTRWALTKTHRRNHEPLAPRSRKDAFVSDVLLDNVGFGLANRAGAVRPGWFKQVARRLPSTGRVEFNDRSYRVFATPRHVRFVESEWAVPVESTVEVFRRVREVATALDYPVTFPVEVRVSAADDITLSTASGRTTGWVSVHMYRGMPHEEYFAKVADVMADYDARPHWGKLHPRTAAELAPLYPGWDEFQEVRAQLDPHGTFENAELRRILGPVGG